MKARSLRAFGCALLFLAGIGPACAAEPAPSLKAMQIAEENGEARLTLEFSAEVGATARPVVDPDRILVDLPEVGVAPDAEPKPPAGGLISDLRFGVLGPGKARLVVALARKACVADLVEEGGPAPRLVLQLKPCDEKQFAAAAPLASHPPAPPPMIVLDPGHGGADGGAHGVNGAVEKLIVFDFASELKRQLAATGRYRIVMTRDGDDYVSLEDRVKLARDAGAALMISIHADTFPVRRAAEVEDVFGTTVYTCSDRASDSEAARIAARENSADRAEGGKRVDDSGVADILFDLKRRETRAYAHIFARGLVSELRGPGRLNKRPERSAGFVVLKAPDFPSVLVELGYLSNPQDVANMTDADWRRRSAAAMVAAVDRFFSPGAGEASPAPDAVAKSDRAATH